MTGPSPADDAPLVDPETVRDLSGDQYAATYETGTVHELPDDVRAQLPGGEG